MTNFFGIHWCCPQTALVYTILGPPRIDLLQRSMDSSRDWTSQVGRSYKMHEVNRNFALQVYIHRHVYSTNRKSSKNTWCGNRSGTSATSYARTLLRILIQRRGYGASDPRDMVLANLSCGAGDHLVADYSKTIKQVYEETANYILQHTYYLSILEQAEEVNPGSQRKLLATWCPDCKYLIDNLSISYSMVSLLGTLTSFSFTLNRLKSEKFFIPNKSIRGNL